MKELLRELRTPYAMTDRAKASETIDKINSERLILGQLEKRRISSMVEFLEHEDLQTLIDEGKITLAIIKPRANEGRNLPSTDQEAADLIFFEIGDRSIFNVSLKITKLQAEDFYSPIRDSYSAIPTESGESVWNSITNYASSGPLTFVLIYDEKGQAVEWWRDKIGVTRANLADPKSIRGKYAIVENLPNNLVHGSESRVEAKREIGILKSLIVNLDRRLDELSSSFPSEGLLKDLEIVSNGEQILSIERIFDSGMRSESWIYGYEILILNVDGKVSRTLVREKSIISLGLDLSYKTQQIAKNMNLVSQVGIPIPKIYGVKGLSIYQEFIENDKTKEAMAVIENGDERSGITLIDQLIGIARKLDQLGYKPINFVDDLIFDGNKNLFLYIDYGADLGVPSNEFDDYCRRLLAQRFPRFQDHILGD